MRVNLQAEDVAVQATFWAGALGSEATDMGTGAYVPAAGPAGVTLVVRPRTAPRGPVETQHLDLTVPWGSREGEVVRLVALGASRLWDVLDEVPGARWTTLADPKGNQFCVVEQQPSG